MNITQRKHRIYPSNGCVSRKQLRWMRLYTLNSASMAIKQMGESAITNMILAQFHRKCVVENDVGTQIVHVWECKVVAESVPYGQRDHPQMGDRCIHVDSFLNEIQTDVNGPFFQTFLDGYQILR